MRRPAFPAPNITCDNSQLLRPLVKVLCLCLPSTLGDVRGHSIAARYAQVLREAEQGGFGYEDFLVRLMKGELQNRRENQRKQRIRQAKFPSMKTLDTFDLKNLPNVDPAQIFNLAEGNFIDRQENVVLIGNPETGKTHISISLGVAACNKGYRVRFYTAAASSTIW